MIYSFSKGGESMKKDTVRKAFFRSLPVMVGYLIIGFGFGMVLQDAGYGLPWALAMSLFIYAGPMQYVGISLITAPASLLTCAVTTLMINARHLFYSISMVKKFQGAGSFKPYLIFALTDETYALLSGEGKGEDYYPFCFFLSLFNHLYWILGTALGSILAASLPFSTEGVNFSMTALFVSAYTEQLLSGVHRGAAILGLMVTLAARLLFGRDLFLIPAMAVITVLLLLKKEGSHD